MLFLRKVCPSAQDWKTWAKDFVSQVGTMYGTLKKGPRYLEMAEGYVTGIALDENDEIIGYKYVNFGRMMDFIKGGDDAQTAMEKGFRPVRTRGRRCEDH